MPEMAAPRENHRQAALVGGGDHLAVADRSAGLDDRGGAGLGEASRPSRNGKKASDAATDPRSASGAAFITATLTASTRLI